MLEVSQLCRSYGDFKAVDDVSFSVGSGEIVGLLGHNGAGKTTIMKILTGYLEPDSGSAVIDGHSLKTALKKVQRELGYLPENLPVYPEMLVADYLDYAAQLKGISSSARQKEISRVVKDTDLAEKVADPIATLSRGFKQRVGVAQAILGMPRLLILDEPTNGLDPAQTDQMRQLLRNIAQDATVILSTHIMQEVEALCHRVLMMRSGRLVLDKNLQDIRNSNSLLLETDISLEKLNTVAGEGLQVAVLGADAGFNRYAIELDESLAAKEKSAQLVKAIYQLGGEVYSIQQSQRDLESLFREVNNSPVLISEKEVSHAA